MTWKTKRAALIAAALIVAALGVSVFALALGAPFANGSGDTLAGPSAEAGAAEGVENTGLTPRTLDAKDGSDGAGAGTNNGEGTEADGGANAAPGDGNSSGDSASGSGSSAGSAGGSSGSGSAGGSSGSGNPSGSGSGSGNPSSGSSGSGSSQPEAPLPPPQPSCTISIDASTMGWGYLMSSRTVTFSEGETVYTVLQRECANAGIVLNTRSGYVVGIGGLNEFDGGKKSGWMYEVNGWSPNYGSTAYYLSKGDNIIWRYTLDLGSDLG